MLKFCYFHTCLYTGYHLVLTFDENLTIFIFRQFEGLSSYFLSFRYRFQEIVDVLIVDLGKGHPDGKFDWTLGFHVDRRIVWNPTTNVL